MPWGRPLTVLVAGSPMGVPLLCACATVVAALPGTARHGRYLGDAGPGMLTMYVLGGPVLAVAAAACQPSWRRRRSRPA